MLLSPSELYNQVTGNFTATGQLETPRDSPTATLLQNEQVLIVSEQSQQQNGSYTEEATSELYDPSSGSFFYSGTLNLGREGHTATLLQNGQILVTGGNTANSGITATAELYDPTSEMFTFTSNLNTAQRESHGYSFERWYSADHRR